MGIHIMPPLYELVIKPPPYGPPITVRYYPTYNASSKRLAYDPGSGGQTWAQVWGAPTATSASPMTMLAIACQPSSNNFSYLSRQIICFPTISLPALPNIISARVVLRRGGSSRNAFSGTPTMNLYGATPANPALIAVGDYDQCGTTPFSSAISHPLIGGGWDEFILNPQGIANLEEGWSKFSPRISWDATNTEPTCARTSTQHWILFYNGTGEVGPPDTRSFLEVTYHLPL